MRLPPLALLLAACHPAAPVALEDGGEFGLELAAQRMCFFPAR